MYRILKPGGRVFISTWMPVETLPFFRAIVDVLQELDEADIADSMRRPFDFMPVEELQQNFESARFDSVQTQQSRKDLQFSGGVQHAVDFRVQLGKRYEALHAGDGTIGAAATNILTATRGVS